MRGLLSILLLSIQTLSLFLTHSGAVACGTAVRAFLQLAAAHRLAQGCLRMGSPVQ